MNEIKFEVGKIYSAYGEKFLVDSRTDEKISFRKENGNYVTVKAGLDPTGIEFVRIPLSVGGSVLFSAQKYS